MQDENFEFGEPIHQTDETTLSLSTSRQIFRFCDKHKCFSLVELKSLVEKGRQVAEIIVADCINDGVPTKNEAGIRYRERIGFVLYFDEKKLPEVRALRRDFPITPHQNHVKKDEPASLCLYFEPWEVVERSWTPEGHVNRVVWWLTETAKGNLHLDDQPLEPFYFQGYFEAVLPPDFNEKIQNSDLFLTLERVGKRVVRGEFRSTGQVNQNQPVELECLALSLQPIVHGVVERYPDSLGTLASQLTSRGTDLFAPLCLEIKRIATGSGVSKTSSQHMLLILQIPLQRRDSSDVEVYHYKGFYLGVSLGELGKACGVLMDGMDGKYYNDSLLDGSNHTSDEWQSIQVEPIEVTTSITHENARKYSGINNDSAEFIGVLAGVGVLGSNLAEIWNREGWGIWTYIDPDYIKPHNLARHIAKEFQIGQDKAEAVRWIAKNTYHEGYVNNFSIVDYATNWENSDVKTKMESADLIVDVTTTLGVPRDLAIANIKRAASVFMTPSAGGSVLLLEDSDRIIRLDSLEAQYYRAILSTSWGEKHLAGHQGHLWVGAGCRDISAVISVELVQLHSATLARHVRLRKEHAEAFLSVWHVDPVLGSISVENIEVSKPIVIFVQDWKIVWDDHLQNKVRQIRSSSFPNETGGVLLGYVDQKLKSVFIVDILTAPPDSVTEQNSFTRGVQDLDKQIKLVQKRTANIVSYVGEWHSHTQGTSANPSSFDIKLLGYLTKILQHEGLPSVMLIVGENEESWSFNK